MVSNVNLRPYKKARRAMSKLYDVEWSDDAAASDPLFGGVVPESVARQVRRCRLTLG